MGHVIDRYSCAGSASVITTFQADVGGAANNLQSLVRSRRVRLKRLKLLLSDQKETDLRFGSEPAAAAG